MRRILPLGAVLAGAALRILPLTDNRFHPDEALYATFARLIASGRDTMLVSVVVDKPPLPFYLMAEAMALFGPTEIAARLPTLFASIVGIALMYQLARNLYGPLCGSLAALALALSPFAILFSITSFMDPLQVTLFLWAMVAAARRRPGWTGVALGLALATKQTTLLFLPLVLAVVAIRIWPELATLPTRIAIPTTALSSRRRRRVTPRMARIVWIAVKFLLPIALAATAITVWDSRRNAPIGFWSQGFSDNAPSGLVPVSELWPRLKEVARLLSLTTASRLVNVLAVAGLPVLLIRGIRRRDWTSLLDLLLCAFVVGYAGIYTVLGLNLWDRYFLVLVPLVSILITRELLAFGEVAVRLLQPRHDRRPLAQPGSREGEAPAAMVARATVRTALIALLAPAALIAAVSGFPIGGDHGAHDGIDQVAAFLSAKPYGAILYDHWLSWELRYYLDDAPIYLIWMPDPARLATDLRAFGHISVRYFVSPSWESDAAYKQSARSAGFDFEPAFVTYRRNGAVSFVVYQLVPLNS